MYNIVLVSVLQHRHPTIQRMMKRSPWQFYQSSVLIQNYYSIIDYISYAVHYTPVAYFITGRLYLLIPFTYFIPPLYTPSLPWQPTGCKMRNCLNRCIQTVNTAEIKGIFMRDLKMPTSVTAQQSTVDREVAVLGDQRRMAEVLNVWRYGRMTLMPGKTWALRVKCILECGAAGQQSQPFSRKPYWGLWVKLSQAGLPFHFDCEWSH